MDYVIETDALTKRYGAKLAVNKMSVHVRKGDIYGLIGKNGAGKTSLMKLILGLTVPTSGKVRLFGSDDLSAGRKKIGSLIESPAIYKNESAFENLKRFSILAPTSDEEINEILSLVGLSNVGKKKAGEFSLGMKQRLGIAIALLGKPELLVLDEPINGLDPAGIKEVRDIIVDLNQKGITFMISSHLLDELGKIATSYGIVRDGVAEEITAEELKEQCRSSLKIVTDDGKKAAAVLSSAFPDVEFVKDGNVIRIKTEVEDASKINKALVKADVSVYSFSDESMGFEDYFIERLGK